MDGLRDHGALTISLITEDEAELVGYVAFSPVKINSEAVGCYGLGPVAVRPDRQRRGVGRALIEAGLDRLRSLNAGGSVVLGDPAYITDGSGSGATRPCALPTRLRNISSN